MDEDAPPDINARSGSISGLMKRGKGVTVRCSPMLHFHHPDQDGEDGDDQ